MSFKVEWKVWSQIQMKKRASLLSILSKVIKMFNEIYNFLIAFYVYLI